MKRFLLMCIIACTTMTSMAQTDSTANAQKNDTIRIGGMVIIRKPGEKNRDGEVRIRNRRNYKPSKVSTNWGIIDLGFSNFTDNTNYVSADAQAYAPGSNSSWFNLRNGKSRNVNIWFFMQRLSVIERVVNLKYGFGVELNNYHYKQNIRYDANPPAVVNAPIVSLDNTVGRNYTKNKLVANYLTVPMMLNFNFTPNRSDPFGFSVGASAGWLYGSHNKTKTSDEGKEKARDDFDLRPFKISYIAELNLGEIKFYGSLATRSMYERGLDMTPYTVGIRISSFD
jgi:hypothetical protein